MVTATVVVTNGVQTVRLPFEVRFPSGVRTVEVRVKGKERIITPSGQTWDSFFLGDSPTSEDFPAERFSQHQPPRESL